MKPINLCEGCAGGSYRKCARTSDEQYYGVTGAFRCLVESKLLCWGNVSYMYIIIPLTSKMTGHIGIGLFVHPSVCSSRTVHARVLKFHIWIPHGKIADTRFFFLVRVISV